MTVLYIKLLTNIQFFLQIFPETMDNHSSIVLSNPLMNKTSADIEEWVRMNLEIYSNNRNIDGPAFPILITLYSFLIILGATGNSLVVIAVIRKPIMRTARNMFIVNLAISGKLLTIHKFRIIKYFKLNSRFIVMFSDNAFNVG